MGFIKRAWRGEEKLWKVFWIYGVLFGIVFNLLESAILYIENALDYAILSQPVVSYTLAAFFLVYAIWNMVAGWRCAFNANWRIWGYLVRTLAVFSVIGVIGGVVTLVLNPPSQSFMDASSKCQDSALQYTSRAEQQAYVLQCMEKFINSQLPADKVSQPTAPASSTTFKETCENNMADHARKNGADPDAYIAQNQAYVAECVAYYESQKGQQ